MRRRATARLAVTDDAYLPARVALSLAQNDAVMLTARFDRRPAGPSRFEVAFEAADDRVDAVLASLRGVDGVVDLETRGSYPADRLRAPGPAGTASFGVSRL